ncbi:hypothetical protein [Caproicibacter sp.]|uniref:hypothetical protein n=1 Tax=Caproicibacter sp. TaxID=2814884 RepID=UPI003988FE42
MEFWIEALKNGFFMFLTILLIALFFRIFSAVLTKWLRWISRYLRLFLKRMFRPSSLYR